MSHNFEWQFQNRLGKTSSGVKAESHLDCAVGTMCQNWYMEDRGKQEEMVAPLGHKCLYMCFIYIYKIYIHKSLYMC